MTRKQEYNSFLQSAKWKEIRKKILSYYGTKCRICNKASKANHVHHIWYDDWENPKDESLRVLCEDHHNEIHRQINKMGQFEYNSLPNSQKWEVLLCFMINKGKVSKNKRKKNRQKKNKSKAKPMDINAESNARRQLEKASYLRRRENWSV